LLLIIIVVWMQLGTAVAGQEFRPPL